MLRFVTAAMAVLALVFLDPQSGARAAGGSDPSTFRLSADLLDRMEAVAAELGPHKRPDADEDDEDDADAESVEDLARKLDADPRVRAALARHGLGSREYATAVLAALHAGMVLATEAARGGKTMPGLTPEQRANVEVLRARSARR
jgi:hypothetical protein